MASCWKDRLTADDNAASSPRVRSAGVEVTAVIAALEALPTRSHVLRAFPGLEADDL